MATKKQDVELGVAVNVTNAERIDALTADLKQLADQGALTTADFERLNNEVKQIGAQAGAADGLAKIETELKQTTDALAQATARADELGATLAEQTTKTKGFLKAQQRAAQELRDTKQQLIEQKLALDKLNNEYDKAGKRTDEYKNKARALKDAIAELEAAQKRQKLALDDANKALSASNDDLKAAETAVKNATKAVDGLASKSQEQSQALQRAGEAVKALGIDSTSAATAQNSLAVAMDRVTQEAISSYGALQRDAAAKEKSAALTRALAELEGMLATEREIATAAAQYEAKVLADEAAAAERAAKAIRDQTLALEQQAQALRESVNAALGTVGVRSAQALRAEINQIRDAMGTLRASGELTGKALEDAARRAAAQVNALELELRQVTNQLTLADRAKLGFNALADGANNLIGRFGALGAAVGTVVFALKPFFDTAIQFDSLRRSLTAVTGSVAEAERQIAFLRETANKAGVSVASISDAFVRFNASARASGISAQVVQDVFSRTAIAAGNLGISSDKLGLILDALSQMANKGVVSMEELRQQLGDSLPGALSLLAKGLGVSEAELAKLVETGRVLAVDALPALADAFIALQPAGGEVQGLSASFNRLKNAITETTQVATQGGGFSALVAILKLLGGAVLGVYTGFMQLLEAMVLGVTTVYRLGEAITTFSTGPLKQLADESYAARERIKNLGGVFADYVRTTQSAKTSSTQAGEAIAQTGQQAAGAAAGHNANTQAQSGAAQAASTNAGAQSASGAAAASGGQQAQGASAGWYALQLSIEKTIDAQEKSILNAETYAKAAKIEGDTRKLLAQLAGDEALAITAAAQASQLESEKLAEVARVRQQGLETLTRERDALVDEAARIGNANKQRDEAIKKLNDLIAARTAESEKANQSAEAARLEALARDTAAKTYADNSAKLDTLRKTYVNTTQAVSALEAALKAGTATQAQVDAAREKSRQAEALYRDAVKDSATAVERKTKALESTLAVDKANAELAKARIDGEIKIQAALGNTARVFDLQTEKKRIDLQVSNARIKVTEQEIALAKRQLDIDAAAIKQNDPLLQQKLKDIELRREAIRVRDIELQRQKEIAAQTERQLQLDQQRGATSLNASSNAVAGLEKEVDAQEKLNALKQRTIDLENKRRGVDAKGFSTDTTGQTVNMEMPSWLSAYNLAKSYGVDDSNARSIANKYFDQQGNWRPGDQRGYETWSAAVRRSAEEVVRNSGGATYDYSESRKSKPSVSGTAQGSSLSYAEQQELQRRIANDAAGTSDLSVEEANRVAAEKRRGSSPPAPVCTPPSGARYVVDLNLCGSTTTINTSSDEDAKKLITFMQNLQSRTAG